MAAASLDRLVVRRRECLAGIRRLNAEITRIDRRLSRAICRELSRERLTGQQRRVLDLVLRDFGNKQIAAELNVTVRTAKFHVSRLLEKFHVADRQELATLARGA